MTNFKTIGISLLLLTVQITFAQSNKNNESDEKAIEKQVIQLVSDWNTHEFKNMDIYTTEDIEWVNIVGMWWKGRTEVKMAHQGIFDTIFKDVPFTKKSVKIRFVTPVVAVANLICHVGASVS